MRQICVTCTLILLTTLVAGTAPEPTDADAHSVVRGMTISCPTWGGEWGSDEMVTTMEKLKGLGVNWVCIHPYAGIRHDGTVAYRSGRYENPRWITRPIEEAHRLGMKIMIKPHIAYWGSKFSWRGEIEFDTQAQWDRFFQTYETWIVDLARISRDADAFAVGTELDRTVQFERQWRDITAAVREQIDAPLTYSANWDAYERVPFWDALDVIGIQFYFPLVNHPRLPAPDELDAGWAHWLEQLNAFAARHDRRIVLGELGYNLSSDAAVKPWEYRQGGPNAEEVQRRCLTAALRALKDNDTVVGAFLWKWFPGESGRGSFIKSTPTMQEVIEQHWGGSDGATERGKLAP